MEIKNQYKYIFFFLMLLFLATYQDFPMMNVFGEIARSPVIFCTPFMLVYIFAHQRIIISKNLSYWIYYVLYVLLISIAYLVIVYYLNNSIEVFYENLIIKTLKMSAYPIVGIIFYQFIYAYLKQLKHPLYVMFHAVLLLQIFTVFWLALEIYFLKKPIEFMSFIHANPQKYWRIRLWTLEESWTGTILMLLTFFPIYFLYRLPLIPWKKYLTICCSLIIFLSYVAVSESKGFLVLVMVCVLPLIYQFIMENKRLRQISMILITLMIGIVIVALINLQAVIFNTFYNNITFGTRFTSIYAALDVFLHSYAGVGFSGFVNFYPKAIESAMELEVFRSLDLREIKSYLSSTKALSTKSEFFDQIIYGGIVYLFFFYKFFVKRFLFFSKIKKQEVYFLRIPLLFIILAGIIYITYHIKYEVWLFLAILDFVQDDYTHDKNKLKQS